MHVPWCVATLENCLDFLKSAMSSSFLQGLEAENVDLC